MGQHAREIPWLGKRNGVFNICWHVPTQRDAETGKVLVRRHTKRLGLRTRDPVEAQKRYVAFLQQGQDVVAGIERDTGLTVRQALDDYYREHVTAKDERGNARVADCNRQERAISHLKDWFGDTVLSTIDMPACHAYIEARRAGQIGGSKKQRWHKKQGSNSTIRRELVVLQAAANHARKWKRITAGEMPTVYKPSESEYEERAKWLTRDELAVVRKSATGLLADFITLAYWWGARRGWVEALHIDQVDLESGVVNAMRAGERRTNKRRGLMPIFPEQKPVIERLYAEAAQGDGYLFGKGGRQWVYGPFSALLCTLGLDDKANPHVLRHSRATHMLMAGESVYRVAKLLHDSVRTVERVYGHHSVEFLKEAAE